MGNAHIPSVPSQAAKAIVMGSKTAHRASTIRAIRGLARMRLVPYRVSSAPFAFASSRSFIQR